jgi:polyisoprenoid-binding protein YceI
MVLACSGPRAFIQLVKALRPNVPKPELMKRTLLFVLMITAIAGAAAGAAAGPQTWTVDPVHSTAQFTARHFGIVPVIGTIPIVKASVTLDPGSQVPAEVAAELDAAKVDTHNDMRDSDLRSAHFFNVAVTPRIAFGSTKVEGNDPSNFTVTGNLTMHGETHPVVLSARVVGSGKSPRGRPIIAYEATATIDRTQWGMTYGPAIVGNSIDLSLNVEADGPQ